MNDFIKILSDSAISVWCWILSMLAVKGPSPSQRKMHYVNQASIDVRCYKVMIQWKQSKTCQFLFLGETQVGNEIQNGTQNQNWGKSRHFNFDIFHFWITIHEYVYMCLCVTVNAFVHPTEF